MPWGIFYKGVHTKERDKKRRGKKKSAMHISQSITRAILLFLLLWWDAWWVDILHQKCPLPTLTTGATLIFFWLAGDILITPQSPAQNVKKIPFVSHTSKLRQWLEFKAKENREERASFKGTPLSFSFNPCPEWFLVCPHTLPMPPSSTNKRAGRDSQYVSRKLLRS